MFAREAPLGSPCTRVLGLLCCAPAAPGDRGRAGASSHVERDPPPPGVPPEAGARPSLRWRSPDVVHLADSCSLPGRAKHACCRHLVLRVGWRRGWETLDGLTCLPRALANVDVRLGAGSVRKCPCALARGLGGDGAVPPSPPSHALPARTLGSDDVVSGLQVRVGLRPQETLGFLLRAGRRGWEARCCDF